MDALSIDGWMSDAELNWLSRKARGCNLVVEIGTWLGRSTYAMGKSVGGKVITIDHFSPKSIGGSQSSFYEKCLPEEVKDDPNWLYNLCLVNLSELIENGKVEVIRGNSDDVINSLQHLKNAVDMVFIDGDHSYDAVRRDIVNYKPLVRTGGLICGHDFFKRQLRWAVMEILSGVRRSRGTSIWACGC